MRRKQSPLAMGILYFGLGILFTVYAIQHVSHSGWGFISLFLILLATLDIGSGIRMLLLYAKIKSSKQK
ncbi:protein of unknown function [Bacillus sp. OV322]|uniref:YdiK family protein n=1 Tax=Bacillus sp. OV322 TaxID=1882764 RepID=UPI0008EC6379|nr:YdiK family protein [Bacillus sp. OV322]SFC99975.1 protein of unknown function [Bacillus sp. OV322]